MLEGLNSIPDRGKKYYFPYHCVQTGLEEHLASYPIGNGDLFPRR
jgi:hypothetical protein